MKVFVTSFIVFSFLMTPLWAEEIPLKKSYLEQVLEQFDSKTQPVGDAFLWLVDGTDTFFSGESEEVKPLGRSHMLFKVSTKAEEGRNVIYDFRVKAHVDLPKTKDRLKLVFSSDEDDDYAESQGESSASDVVEKKDYLLGLRFFKPEKGSLFQYYIQGGAKLHSPIDPYVRLVMTYQPPWFPTWDFVAKQVVSYFYHRELETKSSLTWKKEMWHRWIVSHYNGFYYEEDDERYESVHAFSLEHVLRKRQRVALDLSAHLTDTLERDFGIDYYKARLGYHKQLSEAFGMEAVPAVTFRKSDDYDPTFSLQVNFVYRIGRFWRKKSVSSHRSLKEPDFRSLAR